MLKQYANLFRRTIIVADIAVLMAAFVGAYCFVQHIVYPSHWHALYPIKAYLWLAPLIALPWVATMFMGGEYESFRLKRLPQMLGGVIKSAFYTFIAFSVAAYIFKTPPVNKDFVTAFFVIGTVLLLIEKIALFSLCRRLRSKGFNFRNILIVGTNERARSFLKELENSKDLGLKVVGLVNEDPARPVESLEGHPVLGMVDNIAPILREKVVDYVIFIVPREALSRIDAALMECELVGVTSSVAVDFFSLRYCAGTETNMLGIPMITFEMTPSSMAALFFKRLYDVVLSGIALVIFAPVYLLTAIAIKLDSKGPVFFAQKRVGLNGRIFKLYKFRTMVPDAEAKLKELKAKNEMSGPVFKMENDPRITKVGKFVRKYSLDELPQFWNVFWGDMSLVGPRPPLPSEVKEYDIWHQRRLSMRPGITCLWQVSGRNRITDFDEWVRLDLKYIDEWSTGLDFKILLRTIPAVISTSGAK